MDRISIHGLWPEMPAKQRAEEFLNASPDEQLEGWQRVAEEIRQGTFTDLYWLHCVEWLSGKDAIQLIPSQVLSDEPALHKFLTTDWLAEVLGSH